MPLQASQTWGLPSRATARLTALTAAQFKADIDEAELGTPKSASFAPQTLTRSLEHTRRGTMIQMIADVRNAAPCQHHATRFVKIHEHVVHEPEISRCCDILPARLETGR